MNKGVFVGLLAIFGTTQAVQLGASNIFYFQKKSPTTGRSIGYLLVAGFRTTNTNHKNAAPDAAFRFQCTGAKQNDFKIYFVENHNLMSARDYKSGNLPRLTFRAGKNAPRTVKTLPVSIEEGKPSYNALGFNDFDEVRVDWALVSSGDQDVYVRVHKNDGTVLDYTFETKGIMTAFAKIGSCE